MNAHHTHRKLPDRSADRMRPDRMHSGAIPDRPGRTSEHGRHHPGHRAEDDDGQEHPPGMDLPRDVGRMARGARGRRRIRRSPGSARRPRTTHGDSISERPGTSAVADELPVALPGSVDREAPPASTSDRPWSGSRAITRARHPRRHAAPVPLRDQERADGKGRESGESHVEREEAPHRDPERLLPRKSAADGAAAEHASPDERDPQDHGNPVSDVQSLAVALLSPSSSKLAAVAQYWSGGFEVLAVESRRDPVAGRDISRGIPRSGLVGVREVARRGLRQTGRTPSPRRSSRAGSRCLARAHARDARHVRDGRHLTCSCLPSRIARRLPGREHEHP